MLFNGKYFQELWSAHAVQQKDPQSSHINVFIVGIYISFMFFFIEAKYVMPLRR